MISSLNGTVLSIALDRVVLDVNGVGFAVLMTPPGLEKLRHGQQVRIFTELVVREDQMTLFGFHDDDELKIFNLIRSVSGIGPRIALAVLTVLSPDELRQAIASGDTKAITKTPGVGPKVASRMVLELKDKVGSAPAATTIASPTLDLPQPATFNAPAASDVLAALIGLGWPDKAASKAVADAIAVLGDSADSASLLKVALRGLGSTR